MLLQIARVIFQRQLTRAIALPSVLLLSFSGVSWWQVNRLISAMQWVDHTDQVITQAYRTQKLLLDIQTGSRGYILTGELDILAPYLEARPVTGAAFEELKNLVADNPSQTQRLNQLILLYQEWDKMIAVAVERRRRGEVEPLFVFKVRDQKMDSMRQQIIDFIATEEQFRNNRSNTVRQTTQQVSATSFILAVVIGSILAYFIQGQILQVSKTYENALKTALEQSEISQRSAQRLADLHEIDRSILSAASDVKIIQDALERLRKIAGCQQAFVVLFDFERDTAQVIRASYDGVFPLDADANLRIEDFAPVAVLQQRQLRLIPDIAAVEKRPLILEQLLAAGLHSYMATPMRVQDNLIGELSLASFGVEAFNQENQQMAREVAEQLAIAIQQSQLRQELQNYAQELEQRVEKRTLELQEANQDLEAFNYSVSHDLRAPLRTMQGFAQALLEDYGKQLDTFGQSYLHYIADGAMQMDTLITDLLAYSRLSRSEIQMQPIDLSLVVHQAVKQLNAQIQEGQAQVTVNTPLLSVMAHPATLGQVILNLLSNAIKFVRPEVSPVIEIYCREYLQEGKSWVKLWVTDNGIGIEPEHQERIFRVFERLHGVEVYSGTGIGLAIVRKALEKMGGSCGVESQLGVGSRFWIALPKAES
ncbi:two-component hybrid sensor and regulator [Nostoc sp. NIES-3756]|uniref:sensor histidine kinase n=1 Tax=Nostoc sp. NIES-3756 TaxID=1751286 RepID=UPI00071F8EF8|nr:sensor histidine kinase [Nostoc sp. NIES-3756]BAT52548.1 two-component hybrid sensor and regulator [Nostoc sp. NIES-3756]